MINSEHTKLQRKQIISHTPIEKKKKRKKNSFSSISSVTSEEFPKLPTHDQITSSQVERSPEDFANNNVDHETSNAGDVDGEASTPPNLEKSNSRQSPIIGSPSSANGGNRMAISSLLQPTEALKGKNDESSIDNNEIKTDSNDDKDEAYDKDDSPHGSPHSRLKCDFCFATYSRKDRLKAHLRDKHSGLELRFKCPESNCDKYFKSMGDLRRHRNKHSDLFKCFECNKKFDRKERYKSHIKNCQGIDRDSFNISPVFGNRMKPSHELNKVIFIKKYTSIQVFYGEFVHGFKFCYQDGTSMMIGMPSPHCLVYEFYLMPGETVVGFCLQSNFKIEILQFILSSGRRSDLIGTRRIEKLIDCLIQETRDFVGFSFDLNPADFSLDCLACISMMKDQFKIEASHLLALNESKDGVITPLASNPSQLPKLLCSPYYGHQTRGTYTKCLLYENAQVSMIRITYSNSLEGIELFSRNGEYLIDKFGRNLVENPSSVSASISFDPNEYIAGLIVYCNEWINGIQFVFSSGRVSSVVGNVSEEERIKGGKGFLAPEGMRFVGLEGFVCQWINRTRFLFSSEI